MGRRKWMVHGGKTAGSRIDAEQREVRHPEELDVAFAYHVHAPRDVLANAVERDARDLVRTGHHEGELALFETENRSPFGGNELGRRAFEGTACFLHTKQAGRSACLCDGFDLVHLLA